MTVTDIDLDAIEARANAATPGPPWRWAVSDDRRWVDVTARGHDRVIATTYDDDLAAFIAHARTDVPALVAEVRRLRAQVRDLTDSRQEARNEVRHYAAEHDDARAAIARVRALHYPVPDWNGGVRCHICDDSSTTDGAYPCPTIRALDGDA